MPDNVAVNTPTTPSPQVALITGAGQGIGRACAQLLAAQGWHVVVCGRQEAPLRAVVHDIQSSGGQAQQVVGDLSSQLFWEQLNALPVRPQLLVHNACQPARFGVLESVPFDEIKGVMDSTLMAGLQLAQWAVPAMKAAGFGRLVYVGSAAAQSGAHGQVAYAAAKAGLQGLVRSLAVETGRHGITCNLVEPGFIDTERTRGAVADGVRNALTARTAVGRAGTPDDVAGVVAFLASPAGAYLTGVTIPVTGGFGLGLLHASAGPKARPDGVSHEA
jgi:NAD(P)-dependent dehydrogenase (short-subunit alcohol dehydrogenase family)